MMTIRSDSLREIWFKMILKIPWANIITDCQVWRNYAIR